MYNRKMWAPKDESQGSVIKHLSPRCSMIMALDNHGIVYACLTQENTNSTVMKLYIKELVKQLDSERKDWRKSTIILHDGAKYGQSKSTIEVLKELRLPYMISSPHSYNISPIEMLFAGIKTGNLNEKDLPTGKA